MENACIIGYGSIGPTHANAVSKLSTAHVYAICDILSERADKGASIYGCKAYYSFETALKDENITTFHICTPHYLHFEMAKQIISAGKNVIIEKPVTMLKSEFLELLQLSQNTTSKICTVFQNRTNSAIEKLVDLIASDTSIGKPLGITAKLTWGRTKEYYLSDSWRGKWKTEGGGVLINQSVHLIDMLSYLMGGIESLSCSTSQKALYDVIEVEDTADILIKFKNGCRGCLFATNNYAFSPPMQFDMDFENASFRYADGNLYKISNHEIEKLASDTVPALGKCYWGNGHDNLIRNYYDNGDYITVEDAKNTMLSLFACYESAKNNNKEVNIECK